MSNKIERVSLERAENNF